MPNQSLSGKIEDILNQLAEDSYFSWSGKETLIVDTALKALKSCLVEEIRSFPYTDSKYLDCNCQGLEEHNKMILDDILRKLEEKDE